LPYNEGVLRDLTIKNLAIVEDLSLSFEPGFSVITGETGAGKSILVDAIDLLAGGRASSEMLRHDADRMVVVGRFDPSRGARAGLGEAGIASDGDVVLRREMGADGRGRAFVNDEPVSARLVSKIGDALLTIHGQGGEKTLLDPETALDRLDEFAGLGELAGRVADLAASAAEIERRRRDLLESRKDRDRRLDLLRFEVGEIDEARLEGEDEEALLSERNRLLHADRIRQLGETALQALTEAEVSAADRVGEAWRSLAELARIDASFAEAERGASELKDRISELSRAAREAATAVESDSERLTRLETRLEKLSRLKKKYGRDITEILAHRRDAGEELDRLAGLEDSLEALEKEAGRAVSDYEGAAGDLSARRSSAVRQFSAAVQRELDELAMEKARFRLALSPRTEALSARGREKGEMLFAPNPGEPERPLSKIASGGELSRVQLAVESAAARRRPRRGGRTLIFDEVDAGIGGRVAEVVGRKLKALSGDDQVLCVTHVPQIAALADAQFAAVKDFSRGRTRARVRKLGPEERIEEIARMLAGEKITTTARQHARVLLKAT
jgi:DNA repair protein RecN (Recombination protein N)